MFDEDFKAPFDPPTGDDNQYKVGRIGRHQVVMVCLPPGCYGNDSARAAVKDLKRTFSAIRLGLMVGIAGGIPGHPDADIRLGDVVVSTPVQDTGGVIMYDMKKIMADGQSTPKRHLDKPPRQALSAIGTLQSRYVRDGVSKVPEFHTAMLSRYPRLREQYSRPHEEPLVLVSEGDVFNRDQRLTDDEKPDQSPRTHYGLIATGGGVIASAAERKQLCAINKDILCFEMEAGGIMDELPSVVIRGISDYADKDKRDGWQRYAASTAACYAKELLEQIPPFKEAEKVQSRTRGGVPMQYDGEESSGSRNSIRFGSNNTFAGNANYGNIMGKGSSINNNSR